MYQKVVLGVIVGVNYDSKAALIQSYYLNVLNPEYADRLETQIESVEPSALHPLSWQQLERLV